MSSGEIDVWTLSALRSAPVNQLIDSITTYGVAFTPDSQRVVSIDDGQPVRSLGRDRAAAGDGVGSVLHGRARRLPGDRRRGGSGIARRGSRGYAAVYNLAGRRP